MIDWLTLSIFKQALDPKCIELLEDQQKYIMKISSDGQIDWCTPARESIRSDSHQLTVSFGDRLQLTGSPARVDDENNVFGSWNIQLCALKMIKWAMRNLSVDLPLNLKLWHCSRIDFNHNYFVGSRADVRQVLMYMRHSEGGRYQVKTSSESVYWGKPGSRISGKIYDKGSHLEYMVRQKKANAHPDDLKRAEGLVRLEIKLNNRFMNDLECHWSELSEYDLDKIHYEYFKPLMGTAEVTDMNEKTVYEKIRSQVSTDRRARSIYQHWLHIKDSGFVMWKESISPSTYYAVKKILLDAGLSYADFQAGNVVPIRRKPIILGEPVTSWEQLKKVSSM